MQRNREAAEVFIVDQANLQSKRCLGPDRDAGNRDRIGLAEGIGLRV